MPKQRILGGVALVAFAALLGCGSGGGSSSAPVKPPAPATNANPLAPNFPAKPPNVPPSAPQIPKADLTVSAEQLAKDYAANAETANAKYKGKSVRIDGKVRKVTKDDAGVMVLELHGDAGLYISLRNPGRREASNRCAERGTRGVRGRGLLWKAG